jgi:hypothetical protein
MTAVTKDLIEKAANSAENAPAPDALIELEAKVLDDI